MARFHQYADQLREPAKGVHVIVHYRTWALNTGTWARWVEGADDLDHAIRLATAHVQTFQRCGYIDGADAAAYRP